MKPLVTINNMTKQELEVWKQESIRQALDEMENDVIVQWAGYVAKRFVR